MVYELRIYQCMPNKLPAVLARFQSLTLKVWERHGIEPVGFWTTMIGESHMRLFYMLRWESLAEREAKWPAAAADPEYVAGRNASEADGPLVQSVSNQILSPTVFSKLR